MSRETHASSPSSASSASSASPGTPGSPGTPASNGNGDGSHGSSPQELRAEVEHARGELADTVAELARKADVKSAARDKAARMKERARGGKQSRTHGSQHRHEHGHQDGGLKAVPAGEGASTDGHGGPDRGTGDQVPPAVLWGATVVAGAAVVAAVLARVRRPRHASGARTTARRMTTQPARRSMAKARSRAGTRGKARPGRGARAAHSARCARRG